MTKLLTEIEKLRGVTMPALQTRTENDLPGVEGHTVIVTSRR